MAFSYGENFRVLQVGVEPQDREELKSILALTPIGFTEISGTRLLTLLMPHCEAVVVESNYIDSDYLAGFARFHYMRHHDTNKRCKRLHFFACPVSNRHLLNIPRESLNKSRYMR